MRTCNQCYSQRRAVALIDRFYVTVNSNYLFRFNPFFSLEKIKIFHKNGKTEKYKTLHVGRSLMTISQRGIPCLKQSDGLFCALCSYQIRCETSILQGR